MAGEVCGALSGAALAIGLIYGQEDVELVHHLTEQFMRRFADRNGAVRCSDIIGFNIGRVNDHVDLSSIKGMLQFGVRGGKKMCKGIVAASVEALLEELEDWES
jgi:C_GCAxxG_C_C family probable redox protein